MTSSIRIGTRDSALALWQAKTVQKQLESLGYSTQLVSIKSTGDLVLDKPLYELGITGIFTKTLDVALLRKEIDIAVHSMKDVPTALPKGIVQAAVLERATVTDILVTKGDFNPENACTIATGSLRRKAQWLHRYHHHNVMDLRGNVNTRLQKLTDSDWQGAIFAQAGLQRIDLLPESYETLDWMIPAPAQGAMMIASLDENIETLEACASLNNEASSLCTAIEREFLRTLEGGCTAPIGALAIQKEGQIHFKGCLFSLDGAEKITIEKTISVTQFEDFGANSAHEVLNQGGRELMKEIKDTMTKTGRE